MSVPKPVGPSFSAAHGTSADVFPHKNHSRRHVIDLPHNFKTLKDQVDSLRARWKVVSDDINHQSATRQRNDNHAACHSEIEWILKYYQENIVNRYKKLVGIESGGNQTPVHELSAASKGWKNKFRNPTFYKLARLDKDVLKFATEVTNLENKITLEHVTSRINPEIVVRQSAKELTHVPSHQAVLDSLFIDGLVRCKRIIIHGEPQVGKTNILRNLNNRLVQCHPGLELDYVIWVTFPTHLPEPEDIITDIQDKILQRLGLNGQSSRSGKKLVISRTLREKSYLLLFDGFSSSIELEDFGISEEHVHGKVIIEAKDPYLLRNFPFDKAIKLERLQPQDSRKLFDNIIYDETFCEENTVLADLIVKELGGLPGVITSVAGQLKINKRVQYWEGMIRRLKADIWDNNLLELAGLAAVKLAFDTAYSKLKENDRKCILYAALFPKDFTIPIDILVECWKAEEFLWCPIPTLFHARREGACVLKQLIELNLLEKCFEHHVKMPIIYRRLALETPFPGEKNATSFVRWGPEIDGHLKDEEWEMARRVSLIQSQLEELPANPKCEGMSTLFLQLNPNLTSIEEPFFRRMQDLRVLDLHSKGIKLLPPSISYLTSLRSLYLNNCCDLTVLPPEIVKLKKLEVLDIRSTSIHCFPEEISSLFGLRCLRFSFVLEACNPNPEPEQTWLIFPPGTADQLNKLEELTIVLVNGSSEGIVGQIETEVLEFKNKNNLFKLILHRPSQSVDQGNLVQQKGKGVYLPNPSVSASHVHDPTTGNHPSVRASHVYDRTTGNQSPRSDNKRTMASSDLETRAKGAFIGDHFELAVDLYSQAISVSPTNAELFADRAQANIKLNNFTEAVADANKAIELDPSMPKAYFRKGLACIKLEEYQTAKTALEVGASLAPGDSRFNNLIKECDQRIAEENGVLPNKSPEAPIVVDTTAAIPKVAEPAISISNQTTSLSSAKPKYRHEYYQKPEQVVVTIFAKGIPAKNVSVDFGEQILSVTIDVPGEDTYTFQPRLFGKIIPANCRYEVLSTKIEIRLAKAEAVHWASLEYSRDNVALQRINVSSGSQRPTYPSSRATKDWDKLEAQMKKEEKDEKLDGDAALNKFFRDIYKDADEDTRRAMMKAFVESNGTVLSTNWKEVGAKKVEGSPPDGMEMKKWEY